MGKLYSAKEAPSVAVLKPQISQEAQAVEWDDNDFSVLSQCTDAFVGLTAVGESLSTSEGFALSPAHGVIFDQYVSQLTKNLGVERPRALSLEGIQEGRAGAHYEFALEGFISNIWGKLKSIFSKIMTAIKEFFAKYFTRLGRLKNKLNNLRKVLGDTQTDLKTSHLEEVPSGIKTQFPYSGIVSDSIVSQMIDTAKAIHEALSATNTEAIKLSKQNILDAKFVSQLKSLAADKQRNQEKIAENEEKKSTSAFRSGEERKSDQELTRKNEDLAKKNTSLDREMAKRRSELDITVKSEEGGEGIEGVEDDLGDVKAEFDAYMKVVENQFKRLVKKPIPKGMTILEVKVSAEDGIEIEFDRNVDSPDSVTLGDKATLKDLTKAMLAALEEAIKITDKANDVNSNIDKNLSAVDRLIQDLDKTEDELEAKYKKLLQNKISQRLKLLQTFFRTYNKLNKNLLSSVADIGDGVVAYSVLSLKHFG